MQWLLDLTPDEWNAVRLSIRVATVAMLFSLPAGILIALLLARGKFWGKSVLNGLVRRANASGARDADAEDRRDALLDELAALAPIQVRPQGDGMVTVSFGGMVGVQGTEALPISLALPPDVPTAEVRANGSTRAMALSSTEGGVLGAQLHLLNTAIPGARAGLAQVLVHQVLEHDAGALEAVGAHVGEVVRHGVQLGLLAFHAGLGDPQ